MRKALLVAAFAGLLLLAAGLFHAVAPVPEEFFSRKDPARVEYERFQERFDDRRYGFVQVRHREADDPSATSEEITAFLLSSPGVSRVVSPQNARFFLSSEYFNFASLFPRPVFTEDARDRLRFEIWRRTLFPDEPGVFTILFENESATTQLQERDLTVNLQRFLESIEERYPGVETSILGPRLLHGARLASVARSFVFEIGALLVGLGLIIAFFLRSPVMVAWSMVSLFASMSVSVILLRLVSGGVSSLGMVAVQAALAITSCCVAYYFALLQTQGGRLSHRLDEARALGERTALYFTFWGVALSLGCLLSNQPPIRELGVVTAVSCLFQWVVSFRLIPVALKEFGLSASARRTPFMARLKSRSKRPLRPLHAALACLAVFVLSSLVTTQLLPGDRVVFSALPLRRLDLLIKPKYWDAFDPDNQAELLALEQKIAELPGVDRVASLSALSDDLFSFLAMRRPGQGEKLRRELLAALDELGALQDFRAPKAKETRTVVWLKPGGDYEETLAGIDQVGRQSQGRITVQLAGLSALRKALSAP